MTTTAVQEFYPDLGAAGKAVGESRGFFGKKGGWIYRVCYDGQERPICHGWASLAVTVLGIYAHSYVPGKGYPVPERYREAAAR